MMVSSMYLCRYDVYRTLFFTKISTVMRYGVMGVFCLPLIPAIISGWNKKQIKSYATLAIVCMSLISIPFITSVQSNLSSEYINRMDFFNYRSPWLISREMIKSGNETGVLVICEPIVRVRFYYQENVTYIASKDLHWLNTELGKKQAILNNPEFVYEGFTDEESIKIFKELILSQYQHVYLYGEKYSLYEIVLEGHVSWYWNFLQNKSEHEIVYENEEMYLYKVILN